METNNTKETMETLEISIEDKKIAALMSYLNETDKDAFTQSTYDENVFEYCNGEYLVLDDNEADIRAKDYILDSIWAFNASFLVCHAHDGIDESVFKLLQDKCEGANEAIKSMIKDIDHFIDDAISSDGRGHFINSYDGEENESNGYYIYRVN